MGTFVQLLSSNINMFQFQGLLNGNFENILSIYLITDKKIDILMYVIARGWLVYFCTQDDYSYPGSV